MDLKASAMQATEPSLIDSRKNRMLIFAQISLSLILIVFLYRAFSWNIIPRMLSLTGVAISIVLSIIARQKGYYKTASELIVFSVAIAAIVGVATSGGLLSSTTGWLLVVPCMAGLLGGRSSCQFWGSMSALVMLILLLGEMTGSVWPNLTPEEYRVNHARTQVLMQLATLLLIMLVFLREFESYEKRYDEQLQQTREQAARTAEAMNQARSANQAKTRFLMNMSHELRTPLNSVIGFSKRLLHHKEGLSERDQNAIDAIYRNGKTLLSAVNELLELANLESNAINLNWQSINLAEIAREAQASIKFNALEERDITYGNLNDFQMIGDTTRLIQAICQIVDYSCLESKNGPIRLSLSAENTPDEKAHLLIDDQNNDVDLEEVRSLFKVDGYDMTTKMKARPTTGLGLAISARLIEMHEGELKVSRNPEGGLRFDMSFSSVPPSYGFEKVRPTFEI